VECFLVEDDKQKKQEIEQLKNAEKKFQTLIDRRNELNDTARLLREERDMLNEKRKDLSEEMKKNKKERDDLVSKMKQHKEMRNEFQQQAKELIKKKQQKKGDVVKSLPILVEELKADIQMLEYRQETVPMTSQEENDLIDKIREKRQRHDQAKDQMKKQKVLEMDLSDTDKAITELFKKADEQHNLVQKYYDDSQKKHKDYMKLVREISVSINESNKKHKHYMEVREEAQANHLKANEMRSKILSIKQERRKRYQEAKQLIKDQNIKARELVADKKKLDKVRDDSVSALKKGQKISLT